MFEKDFKRKRDVLYFQARIDFIFKKWSDRCDKI
jgi:hypothetical protein